MLSSRIRWRTQLSDCYSTRAGKISASTRSKRGWDGLGESRKLTKPLFPYSLWSFFFSSNTFIFQFMGSREGHKSTPFPPPPHAHTLSMGWYISCRKPYKSIQSSWEEGRITNIPQKMDTLCSWSLSLHLGPCSILELSGTILSALGRGSVVTDLLLGWKSLKYSLVTWGPCARAHDRGNPQPPLSRWRAVWGSSPLHHLLLPLWLSFIHQQHHLHPFADRRSSLSQHSSTTHKHTKSSAVTDLVPYVHQTDSCLFLVLQAQCYLSGNAVARLFLLPFLHKMRSLRSNQNTTLAAHWLV